MKTPSSGYSRHPLALARLLVAALFMVTSFLAIPISVSAAQGSSQEVGPLSSQTDTEETVYVSELTDEEITWSDDWVLDEEGVISEDGLETFFLDSDDGSFFVAYVEGEAALDEELAAYLEGFTEALGTGENVDAAEVGDSYYSLDLVEGEDLNFALFSVITQVDDFLRVDTVATDPDLLGDLVDSVKATIERDGDEVFAEIETVTDTEVELAVADDDEDVTPDDEDVTPDDEDVTPDDEDVTPDDEDVTPDDEDVTPDDEDVTLEDEELSEDWIDAGLVSATEYESPQFSYTVEWNEPWVLDEYYDDPENGTGTVVTEDGDSNADLLHIWIEDLESILRIQGFENTSELTTDDYLAYWESDDYLEGFSAVAESLSVEGDADVAASLYYLDSGFIGYNQVTLLDDGETLEFLFFLAPVDSFEEAFELAQEEIEIDGVTSFEVYSSAEVTEAVEDFLP
ncbi:MAG: hypothetical protein WKF81_03865 [Thermomicrobiales bacterium]